ncbi:hypothetical protein GCM10025872_12040 [Barrientosiimonas endolithica]|uniref:ComEC/Rec2-related protein domain-containing protein n=1 Tax=Barrientosiimonas endolithica TaxID=1535208 RepID=A0ABN6YJ95_9MICO|nr:hypothetical protein GCM10025872_12040 [Barrientosiimonas endolithica]
MLVFGDEAWAEMRWGQTVLVTGRLSEPDPGAAETAVLAVSRPPRLVADAPAPFRAVEVLRGRLRDATDPLPADPRGLVPALVIGDTSRLPGDLVDDMQATGMTHLTAVSGANVSILLLAVVWCCGWLRIPRRGRLPVCLVALAVFVLLCRPEPSVVRASAMGVVGLLATSSGRPAPRLPRSVPPSSGCWSSTRGSRRRTVSRCPCSPRSAWCCSLAAGAGGSPRRCRAGSPGWGSRSRSPWRHRRCARPSSSCCRAR